MIIIPSILVTSETEFEKNIKSLAGLADIVQIDLADGEFVSNTTWPYQDPDHAQKYLNDIDFELHLMLKNPIDTVKKWINHPRLKRILVHFESTINIETIIDEIKMYDKQVGIVLNPETSVYDAEPYFNKIDSVMLMGVNPGFQGQKFIPETLDRIKKIKEIDSKMFVEVDGGVNANTIKSIKDAGADAVCPGSAIFNQNNPADNLKKLQKLTE